MDSLSTRPYSGKRGSTHLDKLETAFEKTDKTNHYTNREKQIPIYNKLIALHLKFPDDLYYEHLIHFGIDNEFNASEVREIARNFGIHFRRGNRFAPHITNLR